MVSPKFVFLVQVDCSVMSSAQKNGQIENEFDCSMSNVVAFELYNYFDLKMNGFSKSGIFSKNLSRVSHPFNEPKYFENDLKVITSHK